MKQNKQIPFAIIGLVTIAASAVMGQEGTVPARPEGTPSAASLFYSKDRPMLPPRQGAARAKATQPVNPSNSRQSVSSTKPLPPDGLAVPPATNTPAAPQQSKESFSNSGERANAYVVEEVRPQRVKVFPDDPDSALWEINPHYAFLRAEVEQKPLMLLFTSQENPQAMKLSEEVFSTKSFNEYVKGNMIICYLNYPRNITDAPMVMRKWKKKFKIKGLPNVLIFNPQGEIDCHIIGYRSGRPVDYFNRMKNKVWPILEQIKYRKKMFAKRGYRDWQGGEKGTTIFAKFVKRDSYLVTLMGVNGDPWTVALETLTKEDRAFAESFPTVDQVVEVK